MPATPSLTEQLKPYPRQFLGAYPTPLEFLPRLSRSVGRLIYIKRDDELGPGMGGNKTRKLEYLIAEARRTGARKVATFGGLQSNHVRLTAAACRKAGLEPHIFYFERKPARLTGNLLLNRLMGAHMHFIPFGGGGDGSLTLEQTNSLVHLVAWGTIGRHFFIPVGGHHWLGCLGYVRAAVEIDEQARSLGLGPAHLVLAAGSGGTLAGLMAGLALASSPLQLLGIDVGRLWKGFPASIARLSNEIQRRLTGYPPGAGAFRAGAVPLIESTYVGEGYAHPTPQGLAAIERLARLEGILLDPVYTAKAFAGMLDQIEKGRLGAPHEALIFLHTGGAPALFALEAAREPA